LLAALPHARESIRVVEIVLKFASWHLEIAKFSRLQAQLTGAYKMLYKDFVLGYVLR